MLLYVLASSASAFITLPTLQHRSLQRYNVVRHASSAINDKEKRLDIDLRKPLGIALEEISTNKPAGVRVKEILEGGSAYTLEKGTIVPGMLLLKAAGKDCTGLMFDDVMDILLAAPSDKPVSLTFSRKDVPKPPREPESCTLQIIGLKGAKGTPAVSTKTEQNLRQVLLANKLPVYDTIGKMTNCNGGGQCGTCVVKVVGSGWSPRTDWESGKLKGRPTSHRLSCQTIIEGDATITLQPAKNDT